MAKTKGKELVDLIDELAPQIEKTLHQLATKGPKLVDKGRKMAKAKGAKVPKKHVGQAPASALTKKLVVLGGLGALLVMAVRRALGGGGEWQVDPSPMPGTSTPTDTADPAAATPAAANPAAADPAATDPAATDPAATATSDPGATEEVETDLG
jgi:hypothetical protein